MVEESSSGLYGDPMGFPEISISKLSLHRILEEAVEKRIGKRAIRRGMNGISYADNSKLETNCDILVSADDTDLLSYNRMMLSTKEQEEKDARSSRMKIYYGMAFVDKVLDGHTTIKAGCAEGMLMCYPLQAPKVVINENGEMRQKQMQAFVVQVDERHSQMTKKNMEPQKKHTPGNLLGKQIAVKLERANGIFELPFLDHRMLFESSDSIEVATFEPEENIKSPSLCDSKHPICAQGLDSNEVLTALLDAEAIVSSISQHLQMQRDITLDDSCKRMPSSDKSDKRNCSGILHHTPKLGHTTKKTNTSTDSIPPKGMTTPTRLRNEELVANFSPMEKILLGANGILQDVVASMTGNDVFVKPVLTSRRAGTSYQHSRNCPNHQTFLDRVVDLHVGSSNGPRAVTCAVTVIPYNDKMKDLMLSKQISIGKLLKKLRMSGVEPTFKLLSVGKRNVDNILTRQYELSTPDVTFLIYEEMGLNVLLGKNSSLRKEAENGKRTRTRTRARNSFLRWNMKREHQAEHTAEKEEAFVR